MRYVNLNELSEDQKREFWRSYKAKSKNSSMAYFAWFFFGWHLIYLDKTGAQLRYWFTLGGLLISMILDMFRIPGYVDNHNRYLAKQIFMVVKDN
jgi:hypothetical protein